MKNGSPARRSWTARRYRRRAWDAALPNGTTRSFRPLPITRITPSSSRILRVKADQLRDPDQSVEENDQDGPVADAHPGPLVRRGEERLELLVVERRDDGLGDPGHLEAVRDVLRDVAEPVPHPAERLHHLCIAVHGVVGEAPPPSVQHEGLEIRPPEVGRLRDPPVNAPVGEPPGAVRVPVQGSPAYVPGLAVREELLTEVLHRVGSPGQWSSKGSDLRVHARGVRTA